MLDRMCEYDIAFISENQTFSYALSVYLYTVTVKSAQKSVDYFSSLSFLLITKSRAVTP